MTTSGTHLGPDKCILIKVMLELLKIHCAGSFRLRSFIFIGLAISLSSCSIRKASDPRDPFGDRYGDPFFSNQSVTDLSQIDRFQIEFRNSQQDNTQSRSVEGSISFVPRVSATGNKSFQQSSQSAFVISAPGEAAVIQSNGSTYEIQVGTPNARSPFVPLSIRSLSVSRSAQRGTQTQLQVPLGKWVSISGMRSNDSAGGAQSSVANTGLQRGKSTRQSRNTSQLEIRIRPLR